MKKFILGIIVGIVLYQLPILAQVFKMEEKDILFGMNCDEVKFSNPIYSIDDMTYVPLREFCDLSGMQIRWTREIPAAKNFPGKKEEIKIMLPYCHATNVSFVSVSEQEEFFSEEDLNLIQQQRSERTIQTVEEAVRYALYAAEQKYDASVFDNARYNVFYLDQYDWWCVYFESWDSENNNITVSSEWPCFVILESDGTPIYIAHHYYLGNGNDATEIWKRLKTMADKVLPNWGR